MTPTISRYKIYPHLKSIGGQFFTVLFTKKNGEVRKILAQIPTPLEDPKRPAPAKESNPYVLVTDVVLYNAARKAGKSPLEAKHASYRLINISTIISLTLDGTTYIAVD